MCESITHAFILTPLANLTTRYPAEAFVQVYLSMIRPYLCCCEGLVRGSPDEAARLLDPLPHGPQVAYIGGQVAQAVP